MTTPPTKANDTLMLAVAVALGLIIVAILSHPRGPRPVSGVKLAQAWLECIDCQGPFLRRLHDLPPASRDSVVRFLSTALRKGPDGARTARHERDLMRAWALDSLYRVDKDSADASQSQHAAFLQRYREGFHTKWRGRAAMALGVLRSDPAALVALDSARQVPDTSYGDSVVHRWIERALSDSLGPAAVNHYP